MMRPVAALMATAATASILLLAGCGQPADTADAAQADAPQAETAAPEAPPAPGAQAASPSQAKPAAPGAPAFAVIYPGGQPSGPATLAQGPVGPGGILVFTTEATPDEVIEFYRRTAETAGLHSINAMNQGEARGYSAGDGAAGRGQLLSVVATPVDGETSVQLDWSAGR